MVLLYEYQVITSPLNHVSLSLFFLYFIDIFTGLLRFGTIINDLEFPRYFSPLSHFKNLVSCVYSYTF